MFPVYRETGQHLLAGYKTAREITIVLACAMAIAITLKFVFHWSVLGGMTGAFVVTGYKFLRDIFPVFEQTRRWDTKKQKDMALLASLFSLPVLNVIVWAVITRMFLRDLREFGIESRYGWVNLQNAKALIAHYPHDPTKFEV